MSRPSTRSFGVREAETRIQNVRSQNFWFPVSEFWLLESSRGGAGRRLRIDGARVKEGHGDIGANERARRREHHIEPNLGVVDDRKRAEQVPDAAPGRRRQPDRKSVV